MPHAEDRARYRHMLDNIRSRPDVAKLLEENPHADIGIYGLGLDDDFLRAARTEEDQPEINELPSQAEIDALQDTLDAGDEADPDPEPDVG